MFRRAIGRLGSQHIKPFMFTTIYKRALIKKDKGVVNQEQGDLAPELKEPEQDNSGAIKLHFFSEIKESKPETPASTPTPTK